MSTIAATDTNIVYSPYTWKVSASGAETLCGGAYLRATIDGAPADLSLTFDQTGLLSPQIWVRCDDGAWASYTLTSSAPIPLTLNGTWTSHTVELIMRLRGNGADIWTAPSPARVRFTGFSSTGTISTRPIQRPSLNGLAVGDSLAQGLGAAGATSDARLGWAYPLRDLLGCDLGVRGFGGVGITKVGDNGVPKFGTMWNQLWGGETAADITTRPPDFIVTTPGTNDNGAADATVTSDMTAWLNSMLAATPATTPVVVVANFRGFKHAAIQAGIAACTTPSRVHWVPSTGWWSTADSGDGTHVWGYANVNEIAPRIAAAIRSALGTAPVSKERIRVGGAWVAV